MYWWLIRNQYFISAGSVKCSQTDICNEWQQWHFNYQLGEIRHYDDDQGQCLYPRITESSKETNCQPTNPPTHHFRPNVTSRQVNNHSRRSHSQRCIVLSVHAYVGASRMGKVVQWYYFWSYLYNKWVHSYMLRRWLPYKRGCYGLSLFLPTIVVYHKKFPRIFIN